MGHPIQLFRLVSVAPTFEHMGSHEGPQLRAESVWDDPARDLRSGREILRRVKRYCDFQGDLDNDRHITRTERLSLNRWWYLNAYRLITDILYSEKPQTLVPALPVLNPAPPKDHREDEFAAKPVAWLVAELMKANPSLSDKKLLSHFTRAKLARMLCAALGPVPEPVRGPLELVV